MDPAKNTAGVGALALLRLVGLQMGVEIEVHKKMPLGSGLGSSAASAVGSVFAGNRLSDFVRMLDLYENDVVRMRADFLGRALRMHRRKMPLGATPYSPVTFLARR